MSKLTWRLVTTPATEGPMNMAIDQAIMEAVAADHVLPTLRFYAWEPACLSLGYTQPVADVDQSRLAAQGWGIVRRMTGGRAILHTDELTYSVTLRAENPIVSGGVVESYRCLSQALLNGLRGLGVQADANKRADHPQANGPVCFEVPSHYEITVLGKKLIGSAQVRKFGAVLQHGSLPLTGDITRICNVLAFQGDRDRETVRQQVRQRATTLESVLGRVISWQEVAEAMADSFRRTFGLKLTSPEPLTPGELARAEELRAEQYAAETWNGRF